MKMNNQKIVVSSEKKEYTQPQLYEIGKMNFVTKGKVESSTDINGPGTELQ